MKKGFFMSIRNDNKDNNECDETNEHKKENKNKNETFTCTTGEKMRFIIQGVYFNNDIVNTGGGVFSSEIDHESIDYVLKYKLQMSKTYNETTNINNETATTAAATTFTISPTITMPTIAYDDNFDGTYSGSLQLHLSGDYRISVTLYGDHIIGGWVLTWFITLYVCKDYSKLLLSVLNSQNLFNNLTYIFFVSIA